MSLIRQDQHQVKERAGTCRWWGECDRHAMTLLQEGCPRDRGHAWRAVVDSLKRHHVGARTRINGYVTVM